MTLISALLISLRMPYRVVDFPEPVGPVTSRAPVGLRISVSISPRISSASPSSTSVGGRFDLSRSLMTTSSPSTDGRTATRMSSARPDAALREIRPSCGFRRSAMSSFETTFSRVVTADASRLGSRWTSCRIPSIRMRTTSASVIGSKWRSLAPSSAAWRMIELTSLHERRVRDAVLGLHVLGRSLVLRLVLNECRALPHLACPNDAAKLELDVLRGGDDELERVAGGEAKLVDRLEVRRIGDRDSQLAVLERERKRERALEDMSRHERCGRRYRSACSGGRRTQVRGVLRRAPERRRHRRSPRRTTRHGCAGRRPDPAEAGPSPR